MRVLSILAIFLLTILTTKGQEASNKVVKDADGITIDYFNYEVDSCLPRIFIGENTNIIFPCYSKQEDKKTNILSLRAEIKRLKELVTSDFILKLNNCCEKKKCPDTSHGYYLKLSKNGSEYSQYVDVEFVKLEKCGTQELTELIDLMGKICKNYR